jgi:hypothetical protein
MPKVPVFLPVLKTAHRGGGLGKLDIAPPPPTFYVSSNGKKGKGKKKSPSVFIPLLCAFLAAVLFSPEIWCAECLLSAYNNSRQTLKLVHDPFFV